MSEVDYTPEPKKCSGCGEHFPPTAEFWHKNARRVDGWHNECKACKSATDKRYRESHAAELRESKNLDYFRKKEEYQKRSRAYYLEHGDEIRANVRLNREKATPEQRREKARREYANAPEKARARSLRWEAKNPEKVQAKSQRRRARKVATAHTLTDEHKRYALEFFGNRCAVCGKEFDPEKGGYLEWDHWWRPISEGGGLTPDNALPLCGKKGGCNRSKHNALPHIWLARKYPPDQAERILDRIRGYFASIKV